MSVKPTFCGTIFIPIAEDLVLWNLNSTNKISFYGRFKEIQMKATICYPVPRGLLRNPPLLETFFQKQESKNFLLHLMDIIFDLKYTKCPLLPLNLPQDPLGSKSNICFWGFRLVSFRFVAWFTFKGNDKCRDWICNVEIIPHIHHSSFFKSKPVIF